MAQLENALIESAASLTRRAASFEIKPPLLPHSAFSVSHWPVALCSSNAICRSQATTVLSTLPHAPTTRMHGNLPLQRTPLQHGMQLHNRNAFPRAARTRLCRQLSSHGILPARRHGLHSSATFRRHRAHSSGTDLVLVARSDDSTPDDDSEGSTTGERLPKVPMRMLRCYLWNTLRHALLWMSGRSNDGSSEEDAAAQVQLGMPRRSRQVTFTCNKCGEGAAPCMHKCCAPFNIPPGPVSDGCMLSPPMVHTKGKHALLTAATCHKPWRP